MNITREIYNNLKVGDIIISKVGLRNFPKGMKCPILDLDKVRPDIVIENKLGDRIHICKSDVEKYFSVPPHWMMQ